MSTRVRFGGAEVSKLHIFNKIRAFSCIALIGTTQITQKGSGRCQSSMKCTSFSKSWQKFESGILTENTCVGVLCRGTDTENQADSSILVT